jgi:general secretion pathway protein G
MKNQERVNIDNGRECTCRAIPVGIPVQEGITGNCRGFTMVELIIVVAIVGILATMALPMYDTIREKARVGRAIAEIRNLETDVNAYFTDKGNLPAQFSDLGIGDVLDPWGRKYEYQLIATAAGVERKLFGNNLNTGYDLYSKGKDGQSAPSLADPKSKDDVVLANDGGFIGLGETY